MNTIITIDLSKEILPADIVATIRGENETTMQVREKIKKQYLEMLEKWEIEIRTNINKDLIEKGFATVHVPHLEYYKRKDICSICNDLIQEYAEKGYFTQSYEYAKSNYYKWYNMFIKV